jgi:hypothetical protein
MVPFRSSRSRSIALLEKNPPRIISGIAINLCWTEAGCHIARNREDDPAVMPGLSYYCALNGLESEIHTTHAATLRRAGA